MTAYRNIIEQRDCIMIMSVSMYVSVIIVNDDR